MIVDIHCHAGTGDGLTGPADTVAHLDRYLRRAERAGIQLTVIFPAFNSDYARANREVAGLVAGQPRRLIGFAMLHAERDAGRVADLVGTAVEHYGFRGIKVHRHDARLTREICEVARRYALPLLYDVMGEVSAVELLATEYPEVTFIIPHLGSFAGDWWAHVAIIDLLVRHPNVYTDTAGVRHFDYLVDAVRRAGPRKVLFGSDGPWLHPGLELHKVRLLGLPQQDQALIEGTNALHLLGVAQSAADPAPRPLALRN
jgi:predicted TIM-barrel fold metal-dependent hydrolase